jgi:hypothetical protein
MLKCEVYRVRATKGNPIRRRHRCRRRKRRLRTFYRGGGAYRKISGVRSWVNPNSEQKLVRFQLRMAPRAGFEPATNRLTAGCSTTELPGNTAALACKAAAITKPRRLLKHQEEVELPSSRRPAASPAFVPATARRPLGGSPSRKLRGSGSWRPRPELNRGKRLCAQPADFRAFE